MMGDAKFLPGTGRGTSRRLVEGALYRERARPHAPSTTGFAGGAPSPRKAGRNLAALAAALLLAACGKQQMLRPLAGQPLPPKPATSPVQPDATGLLATPAPYRPGRSDELLTRSETRPDDRFDLPPR